MKSDIDDLKKFSLETPKQISELKVSLTGSIKDVEKQAAVTNSKLDMILEELKTAPAPLGSGWRSADQRRRRWPTRDNEARGQHCRTHIDYDALRKTNPTGGRLRARRDDSQPGRRITPKPSPILNSGDGFCFSKASAEYTHPRPHRAS